LRSGANYGHPCCLIASVVASLADMGNPSLTRILLQFLRLGLTAFGGPAMVPYIRRMAVEKEGWVSEETFKLGMAVSQIIPGATAMQVAAFVGLRTRGGPGALAAYIGFGLPAFLLMLGLSALYFQSGNIPAIAAAFKGLQMIIVALIANAAINFGRRYIDNVASGLLAILAGGWLGFGGNPIIALVTICLLAILVYRKEQFPVPATAGITTPGRPLASAIVFLVGLLGFLGLLFSLDRDLFGLGILMAKIDCFAFGGGYVSVPLMLHEVVETRGWLTNAQFMDGIALGQVTPGPIVMTGAFVGYAIAGIPGAAVAAVAVFTPSLIFLCAASPFADKLIGSVVARHALKGSLVSLVGLMAAVAVRFTLSIQWGIIEAVVAVAAFVALRLGVDILWVVLAGAGISAVLL